ncbi:MAG: hypothetical protein AB1649_16175 [Chloroflexota bacterium]
MRTLEPDEKCVKVMTYTRTMLIRGGLIAREGIRVSIWLRSQGVSNFLHLVDPQVLLLSGAPKSITYSELYVPTNEIMAFHVAPPEEEAPDFDTRELNQTPSPVSVLAGAFSIKGKIRISSQTGLGQSLDVLRTAWVSLYEAEITNPNISQFHIQVPMMLVNSSIVSFGV